jgi:hypothetical protein
MIDAVGRIIAVDDAVTVAVGGNTAGHRAWGWWRRGCDRLVPGTAGKRKSAESRQHKGW